MTCEHCDVWRERALAVWRERALRAEADADWLAMVLRSIAWTSGEHVALAAHDEAVAQRGEP